jgi:hypothetical protein
MSLYLQILLAIESYEDLNLCVSFRQFVVADHVCALQVKLKMVDGKLCLYFEYESCRS